MLFKFKLLVISVLLAGCASKTYQTKDLLKAEKLDLPRSKQLKVPFYKQQQYYCGPATLAMLLEYQGSENVSIQELEGMSFSPNSKGAYQTDMLSSIRRQGYLSVPVNNMTSLVKEIDNNNPVLVFRNLGFSWYPLWHYSIVTGYDLDKQNLIEHSGEKSHSPIAMKHFERGWNRGDYWGLIILKPGEISETATLKQHLNGVAGLEQLQYWQKARQSYTSLLKKWPDSATIYYGLGNIAYHLKDYPLAEKQYSIAVKKDPQLAFAWHNLALAQKSLNKLKSAKNSAEEARKLAPDNLKNQFNENLKDL